MSPIKYKLALSMVVYNFNVPKWISHARRDHITGTRHACCYFWFRENLSLL